MRYHKYEVFKELFLLHKLYQKWVFLASFCKIFKKLCENLILIAIIIPRIYKKGMELKKNLYILSDKELKRDGNILKIDDNKIPISMVANVYLFSNATITKGAQNLLLKNKRSIFYFNKRYELSGILSGSFFNNYVNRRIKQYENMNNLDVAKKIVEIKIKTIEEVFELKLPDVEFDKIDNYQTLLGFEGVNSSAMFNAFKKELEKINIKEFKKREYKPAKDRINGLLSFLYTLYYSFVYGELVALGFDPYVGMFHRKRGDHAVLCSDVMEEARVHLTKLAVGILEEIYPDGFDGIYLNYEARKKVVSAFDKFLVSYENKILKYLITTF